MMVVVCNLKFSKGQFTHSRQDVTNRFFAHNTVVLLNKSVHTCATQLCLVVTTKSCGYKNRSGSDFCHVLQ